MTATVTLKEPIVLVPRSTLEEVLQNVRMILGVWRGSVPLDREFGIDAEYIDAPIGIVRSRLAADLAQQIKQNEPRARLKELTFAGNAADGTLEPIATVYVEE